MIKLPNGRARQYSVNCGCGTKVPIAKRDLARVRVRGADGKLETELVPMIARIVCSKCIRNAVEQKRVTEQLEHEERVG